MDTGKDHDTDLNEIQPGMEVEDAKGLLGEHDVKEPKVSKVMRNQQDQVEDIVVSKGLPIDKKEFVVPADQIEAVEPASQQKGRVVIETPPQLEQEERKQDEQGLEDEKKGGLLGEMQRALPTAEGMRELEEAKRAREDEQ